MPSSIVRTWGAGGAFGREFGLNALQRDARQRRGHASASLIVGDRNIVIDAGAQCAEMMIDNDAPLPEIVFLTHEHTDHYGGLDQLVHSRKRSLILAGGQPTPLTVVATEACLRQAPRGVALQLPHLDELVRWISIPKMNVWCLVDGASDGLTPSAAIDRPSVQTLVEFKAMRVFHTEAAPGACMYLFRITEPDGGVKRVVFSGDFSSMDESVLTDPDLQNVDMAVMETNTLETPGRGHSTLARNLEILRQWRCNDDAATAIMTHISGYEDCADGSYDHVPNDNDWLAAIDDARIRGEIPRGLKVEIARDGGSYPV